jgi:hypothetical protein
MIIPNEIYYKIISYIPRYNLTGEMLIDQKYRMRIINRLKHLDVFNDNIRKDVMSKTNLSKQKYYEYEDDEYFISLSIKKISDFLIIYS